MSNMDKFAVLQKLESMHKSSKTYDQRRVVHRYAVLVARRYPEISDEVWQILNTIRIGAFG